MAQPQAHVDNVVPSFALPTGDEPSQLAKDEKSSEDQINMAREPNNYAGTHDDVHPLERTRAYKIARLKGGYTKLQSCHLSAVDLAGIQHRIADYLDAVQWTSLSLGWECFSTSWRKSLNLVPRRSP